MNGDGTRTAVVRYERALFRVACAKVKRLEPLTEQEAALMGFDSANLTHEVLGKALCAMVKEQSPPRNTQARIQAIRTAYELLGAFPAEEVNHSVSVTLDSLLRQAQSPSHPGAVETQAE